MVDLERIINSIDLIRDNHLKELYELFKNNKLNDAIILHNDFIKESEMSKNSDSFNIFFIVSDNYKKEKFHSEIIAYFLKPEEKHKLGYLGIDLFIQMLKTVGNDLKIEKAHYKNAKVILEYPCKEQSDSNTRYIDILIKGDGHCIIIENKMNQAPDMFRQIPSYIRSLEKENTEVDAAVYLQLDNIQTPNTEDWNDDDFQLLKRIITIPAYKHDSINLVNNWLKELITNSFSLNTDLNVYSTLIQYINLIINLSNNNMDSLALKKFYEFLKENDNYEKVKSLIELSNDLPKYLAKSIFDEFNNPDIVPSFCKNLFIYKDEDTVFNDIHIGNIHYKIDVFCSYPSYSIVFWAPEDYNSSQEFSTLNVKDFVDQWGIMNEFKVTDDTKRIIRKVSHIEDIIAILKQHILELSNLKKKMEA